MRHETAVFEVGGRQALCVAAGKELATIAHEPPPLFCYPGHNNSTACRLCCIRSQLGPALEIDMTIGGVSNLTGWLAQLAATNSTSSATGTQSDVTNSSDVSSAAPSPPPSGGGLMSSILEALSQIGATSDSASSGATSSGTTSSAGGVIRYVVGQLVRPRIPPPRLPLRIRRRRCRLSSRGLMAALHAQSANAATRDEPHQPRRLGFGKLFGCGRFRCAQASSRRQSAKPGRRARRIRRERFFVDQSSGYGIGYNVGQPAIELQQSGLGTGGQHRLVADDHE